MGEIRKHRGKDIRHWRYVVIFNDGTELDIFVPHYFETIGTKRRIIKELERNRLKQRSEKINKIICTTKK